MWKLLLLFCLVSVGHSRKADVDILDENLPNGDETEMVSVDLKKSDGSEDIIMTANLHFCLKEGRVFVNGHPVQHKIVNAIRMHVSIVEIERGIRKEARFAPVLFRILVQELPGANGNTKLVTEVEFVEVEKNEVRQVDVKQITWEGSNRLPVTSVSFHDSVVHNTPRERDHRVLVKRPKRFPFPHPHPHHHGKHGGKHPHPHHHGKHGEHGHGKHGKHGHGKHGHGHHHRHGCWFHRLSIGGKIVVVGSAALLLIGLIILTVICCKRRRRVNKTVAVEAPKPDVVVKDDKEAAKVAPDHYHFHMEVNGGFDSDDKKDLIVD